ncbi:MAG: hypothetical protein ACRCW9_06225 [Cetobacterium sp.]
MNVENFKLIIKLKLKEQKEKYIPEINKIDFAIKQLIEVSQLDIKTNDSYIYNFIADGIQKTKDSIRSFEKAKKELKEAIEVEIECPNCQRDLNIQEKEINDKFFELNEKIVCSYCISEEIKKNKIKITEE